MAARRTRRKSTTRRRSKQGINILNAAQSYVVASAATKAMFGVELVPFLTEGWLSNKTTATDNSWELSLQELFNRTVQGGTGAMGGNWNTGGIPMAIKHNLRNNTGAIATMIFAPIAFKAGKALTSKPRRDANKLLKMAGLSSVVKV